MNSEVDSSAEAFRERVRQAKQMTPDERLQDSLRLTEIEIEAAKERVRKEFPTMTEQEVIRELRARRDEVERAERLGFTVINGHLKMRGDPPTSTPR